MNKNMDGDRGQAVDDAIASDDAFASIENAQGGY